MEVAEIVEESADCRSFYLVDPYRQPLPDFRPGQHLIVRPALAGAYQTTRCYSLSSSPDPRYWRITVKRQEPESQQRGPARSGGLSVWLHDGIGVGDCLLIGGPNGQFYLPKQSTRSLVLLAAGVGITPMASMLRWSLENEPHRQVALFYQVKDLQHWPLGESLHRWQEHFPRCQINSFFSQMESQQVRRALPDLPGNLTGGKFDVSHALTALPQNECDYYLCGPEGWMETLRNRLLAAGVSVDQIHWESFGAEVGAQPSGAQAQSLSAGVNVRFDHSQVESCWSDPQQTLWELARESQVEIPSGCLSGVCGSCRVKLLSGEVEYDRRVTIELAPDECLTCVARPKSALRIDA